jgi:glutathione-regulated potassium-efflux system protein KefB
MGRDVLMALGMERAQADDRARRFREWDESLLETQRLLQDDEDALLQAARDARRELDALFEADAGEGPVAKAASAPRD